MKERKLSNIDYMILIVPIILFIIGLVALYSAGNGNQHYEFYKQIKWGLICLPTIIIFSLIDYEKVAKYSIIGYIFLLLFLVVVLFMPAINGSSSWIIIGGFNFQPSEIGKFFVFILISYILSKEELYNKGGINLRKILISLIIFLLPIFLILKQPDYGTALLYFAGFLTLLLISGIDKKYIIAFILGSIIISIIGYVYIIPKYAPHILKRINVFLNPNIDPRGAGYNAIQSKIAVGSGGAFGMGIGKGTQTQLGYLYPKTTDFIFSLISEEMGFIVSSLIVILYIIFVTRIFYISKTATTTLGRNICASFGGMLFFQVVQNIGMTFGLMPITGIPLPFVSYGGSSLLMFSMFLGILINISASRKKGIVNKYNDIFG